jgi:PelA/Pel-15E family pectate lyase
MIRGGRTLRLAMGAIVLCAAAPGSTEVIGTMTPAEPLSEARIAALPAPEGDLWTEYSRRSLDRAGADEGALAAEREGLAALPADPPAGGTASMPLDRDPAWYGAAEARRIADTIVSFQTPAGGWDKNQDRAGPPRSRGQAWGSAGTIDNGATTTELRFLARVQRTLPGPAGERYRAAFLKGLLYLLEAQYPNGGWPQFYPLRGGYHDAVTFNDDALVNVVELLADVAAREEEYAFICEALAAQARRAADRAVQLIVGTQVLAGGKRTGWGQQHDALTLAPVGARNFEPASLASSESAALLVFLMSLPDPSHEVVRAVHAGAAWLEASAIPDVEWTDGQHDGRQLRPKPGAGPLWARFYDIATMRPIYGDRDKTIHDEVNELSLERRNGYSWLGVSPAHALSAYRTWAIGHPMN